MSGCSGGCGSCGGCGEPQEYKTWAGVDRIPAFEIEGVSSMISGGDDAVKDIDALWEEFFGQQDGLKAEDCTDDAIYAVYSDYEGDYTQSYRLTIGYKASAQDGKELPENMHRVQVKEDNYGLMSTAGKQPEMLKEAWTSIWQSDFDRRYKTDFEVYSPQFTEGGVHEALIAVGVNVD